MKKVPLCNAKRLSDPGDEPVTSDDEGPKVCQNPVRKEMAHSEYHVSVSWERKVDGLL